MFDRREELKPNIGGGIQINGGAAVLARLGLGEQMKASALPVRRIWSRKSGGGQRRHLQPRPNPNPNPNL